MPNLLLLSNSTVHGGAYLGHAGEAIAEWLGGRSSVVFVPFALADHDTYTARVAEAFAPLGVSVTGAHTGVPAELVSRAEAVFIGGGNSFRLLKALWGHGLVGAIRDTVRSGTPYLGSSAGTNMACPSLRTTNDMPIVQPPTFEALGLVPFQINPHYLDPEPGSTHMGETRAQRLAEFHEENDVPVLAMREGAWLRVHPDGTAHLGGQTGGLVFGRGEEPSAVSAGSDLTPLFARAARFDTTDPTPAG